MNIHPLVPTRKRTQASLVSPFVNATVTTEQTQSAAWRVIIIAAVATAIFVFMPQHAAAATQFEVTGWIPFWRAATGTVDVLPHLDSVTEINPFVYTLKQDGTLFDNGAMDQEPWLTLMAEAKKKGVRVIPTVMSGDRALMQKVLSNTRMRIALEDEIAALVLAKGYDGVDIDFEHKYAESRDFFSTFLKGLDMRLADKWLMCTIETRIPMEDQYFGVTVPTGAGEYSNDLSAINTYCDRVRLMAYDQQGIDRKLQAEHDARGELYAPVGDPVWIEKVVNHMSKEIARDKILIGIPTYGYEYEVTAYSGNEYIYDILWTFNPGWALPIAAEYGLTPSRAATSELFFTYIPGTAGTTAAFGVGANPSTALLASAAASQFATANNSNMKFRMMVWPDAQSVQARIDLAKRLGVRGVSVFKFDGGQDPAIWGVLASAGAVRGSLSPSASAPQVSVPSSSGTSGALSRGLDLGALGEDVRTLQQILNTSADTRVAASGVGSSGSETTYFGPATSRAVKKFQEKYGLAKTGDAGYGYVGPRTRAKLNELLTSLHQ